VRWLVVATLCLAGCSVGLRTLDQDGRPRRSRGRREDGSSADPVPSPYALPPRQKYTVRIGDTAIFIPQLDPQAGGFDLLDLTDIEAYSDEELNAPLPPEPAPARDVERALERELESDIERALDAAERLKEKVGP
jgi:hypothetical protein